MIKSNNFILLLGRLGSDPETKTFENGNSVCNFSLATSDKYKNKQGEKVEKTEWHNISAYGKTGEILSQYLKKGSQVQILGTMTYRKWEDKHGQKRNTPEVVVESFSFVGGGEKTEQKYGSTSTPKAAEPSVDDKEVLPF